jgi:Ni,Fe-hydrogenase maturation factor
MSKSYSMHDFDLPITLKLLKKIGSLDSVLIIGVPSDYSKEKAIAEVSKIISSLLSKNG